MSIQELNSTARDLMSVRAMIAELEAEAEALTDKIKGAMVERGTEVLQSSLYCPDTDSRFVLRTKFVRTRGIPFPLWKRLQNWSVKKPQARAKRTHLNSRSSRAISSSWRHWYYS